MSWDRWGTAASKETRRPSPTLLETQNMHLDHARMEGFVELSLSTSNGLEYVRTTASLNAVLMTGDAHLFAL